MNVQLILMLDFFLADSIQEKIKSVSLTSTPLFTLFIQVGCTVLVALSAFKEW